MAPEHGQHGSARSHPGDRDRPRARRSRVLARGGWLAAMLLAATAVTAADDPLLAPGQRAGPAGTIALRAVPAPDLSGAEPSVRAVLEEARANLAKALTASGITDPELADAYGATCGFYLAYRLWEAAEPCYANAQALAPEDYRWPYYLAYRYVQDSHLEVAARNYERALALRPDYLPARVRLGQVYLELGRLQEATHQLEPALADPALQGAALFALGRAALAAGDAPRAAERLESALAVSPEASRIHYPLAMAYRDLGQAEKARAHLGRRGDGEPRLPDPLIDDLAELLTGTLTLYYRGIEAMREGHYDVAAAAFIQALAREPDNVNARITLARALYLDGDRDGARRELDDALARKPDHDLALFLRGVLAEEDGDPAMAADLYRRTLAVAPDHAGAHHYLASLRMREGDYREAALHYGAAVRALPQNLPARLQEALALVRAGDHAGARERLEAGIGGFPEDPPLRQALARLLAASPDDRVRDGGRALSLAQGLYDGYPSLEHAEVLAMALAEAGRVEEAAALQERALEATRQAGRFDLLPRVQDDLDRYHRGEPQRRPWSAFDPIFQPPPVAARGPFQDYPTLSAY